MSTRVKEWLKYALLVAVIIIAGYFGVRYPLPEMPEYIPPEDIEDMELYAVGPTRFRKIYVDHEATIAGALTASGGAAIDGGVTNIGGGTPNVAAGDNDLFVTADLEVDGEAKFDGTVDMDAVMTGQDGLEHIFFPTTASTAFTYTASAGGAVGLFTIPDGEIWFVHDVLLNVTTNFDCTGNDCTLHIGDGGDEDGLCDLDDGELQTTDTEVTGIVAGWQCLGSADVIGAYLANNRAMIYAPSGAATGITATLAASGDDFSAGAATAYIVYTRIQ